MVENDAKCFPGYSNVHVLKCTFWWALKFEFSRFFPSTGIFQENPVFRLSSLSNLLD